MHGLTDSENRKLSELRAAMREFEQTGDPQKQAEAKRAGSQWANSNKARRGLRLSALRTVKGMYDAPHRETP